MRTLFYLATCVATLGIAACNHQESPAQTRQDVAAAQKEGREDVAEAKAEREKTSETSLLVQVTRPFQARHPARRSVMKAILPRSPHWHGTTWLLPRPRPLTKWLTRSARALHRRNSASARMLRIRRSRPPRKLRSVSAIWCSTRRVESRRWENAWHSLAPPRLAATQVA